MTTKTVQWQWQWPSRSRSVSSHSPFSKTDFPPFIQSSSLSLRPQQPLPHMGIFSSSEKEVGPSRRPEPKGMEEDERGHISSSSSSSSRLHRVAGTVDGGSHPIAWLMA